MMGKGLAALVLALVLAGSGTAAADARVAATRAPTRDHAVFVEGFGRGGIWGLGYSYQLHPRFALGAVASAGVFDGQRLMSFSPFVTAYPLGGRHHRWFVDAGPQLAHLNTPSPVPEWDGTSSTGVGAHVATGYELRAHVLVRVFAMLAAGDDGVAPWFGAAVGWTL